MDYSHGHSYDDEHPWHDTRKAKRKRKQRLTAVAPPADLDLAVNGTGCSVLQDDGLAKKIEIGFHLINYFDDRFVLSDDGGDSDDDGFDGADGGKTARNDRDIRTGTRTLYIDRYDVRMLVDDYSTLRRRGSQRPTCSYKDRVDLLGLRDKEDGLTKQQIDEINFDRFGALPEYRYVFLGDGDGSNGDDDGDGGGNSAGGKATAAQDAEEEPFKLTEEEVKCLPSRDMILVSS
jgi:hypothetical protein